MTLELLTLGTNQIKSNQIKFFIDMKSNKESSSAAIQSTDTQNMKQLKTKSSMRAVEANSHYNQLITNTIL